MPLITCDIPRWESDTASSIENNDVIYPAGKGCKVSALVGHWNLHLSHAFGNDSPDVRSFGEWHECQTAWLVSLDHNVDGRGTSDSAARLRALVDPSRFSHVVLRHQQPTRAGRNRIDTDDSIPINTMDCVSLRDRFGKLTAVNRSATACRSGHFPPFTPSVGQSRSLEPSTGTKARSNATVRRPIRNTGITITKLHRITRQPAAECD